MTKSLFSRTEFFLGIVVLLVLLLCIKTITILQNISNLTENIPGSTSIIISEVNASSGNTSKPKPNDNKSVIKASDNVITHESSDNIAIGNFNSDQVKLLKKLYERRETIRKQEENLKNQENILKALSFNVTHKIQELKALQKI